MLIVDGTTVFEKDALKIGKLVSEKNEKYGKSFQKAEGILKILYPNGISLEDYRNVLTITRILDKRSRISVNNDSDGENPYQDIAGYCILSCVEDK